MGSHLAAQRLRPTASLAVKFVAPAFGLLPVSAQAVDSLQASRLVGGWDMSLNDTNRRCTLMLREDPAHVVGMPAGCRRALPILTDVDAWKVEGDQVGFTDRDGGMVLQFAALDADRFAAQGPEGETYELAATGRPQTRTIVRDENDLMRATRPSATPGLMAQVQIPAPAPAQPPAQGGFQAPRPATAPARQPAPSTTARPTAAPAAAASGPVRAAELAGRYAILREGTKDTLCMLTLDTSARGPRGTMKAQLAPACRDQGVVVFEPMGWQIERNKLVLTARKGHKASFELTPDGSWQKDPKEGGKALGFRKM